MTEFVTLRSKTYSSLADVNDENKKANLTKHLEEIQLENKINRLEKNKLNVDILREKHK